MYSFGTVKHVDTEKRFGFIELDPSSPGRDNFSPKEGVFFHFANRRKFSISGELPVFSNIGFPSTVKPPQKGDLVVFVPNVISKDNKDKNRAFFWNLAEAYIEADKSIAQAKESKTQNLKGRTSNRPFDEFFQKIMAS